MEINGYQLKGEMTARNAGFSKWTPCVKDGHEFFIKEFLSPVYPVDASGLSERLVQRKRKTCDEYFARKSAFYDVLAQCRTGNNIVARDFFRSGSRYYLVTDWVNVASIGTDEVCMLSELKRMTLVRALLYSIASLHSANIVHADLKPDNLLLKQTKAGYITAKVIDFDAGFIEGDVPKDVQGDFVYLAPEVFLHMDDSDVPIGKAIDVFALGLIIHQYWTGSLPSIESKYHYTFESVLNGEEPVLDEGLPESLRRVILQALLSEPSERITVADMLKELSFADGSFAEEDVVSDEGLEPFFDGFYIPAELG